MMPVTTEQSAILRKYSVDEIEEMYREKEIFASDRNWMLREKARITLQDLINREGTTGAMLQKFWDHASEGWENFTEGFRSGGEDAGLYHLGLAVWGQLQMLGAASEAIGEVAGMNAETFALSWGAPAGLARAFNSATYWGTQFVPVASVVKLGAKAGEKVLPKVSESLAKEAAGSKLTKETIEELHALRALTEGLEAEGIKDAGEVMERVAQSAFKTDTATALKRVREGVEKIEKLAQPQLPSEIQQVMQKSFTDEARDLAKGVTLEQARAELPKLMKRLGVSFNDLRAMKKTDAPKQTAQEFYGYLKALDNRGAELSRLAKAATKENATPTDQAAFFRYATSLFTGDANRTTVTKEFQNLLIHWAPAQVGSGDIAGAMKVFAEDMAKLKPREASHIIFKSQDGFFRVGQLTSAGREAFSNLLLPLSWPAATIGNLYATGLNVAERFVGRLVQDPLHPQRAATEAFFMAKGMMLATGDAIQAGWMAIATSPARNAIPGVAGRVVNFQRDTLIAVDSMTKVIVGRGNLYADALQQAHQLGVTNVGAFVRNFMQNPPPQFFVRAWEQAEKATFSNNLGPIASKMQQAAQSGPGYAWFTFVKSPINLYKHAWYRTPGLQLLSSQLLRDIAAGGNRASDAMARLTLASLTGAFFFELAKDGWITGSGPADPKLRGAWRGVNEPFSVKPSAGGGWVPLTRMEPATQPVTFTADVAQIMDQLDDFTFQQAAMAITLSWVKNFANMTAWRNATDIIDVINGTARGERLTQRDKMTLLSPGMAIATGGPLVARTTRALDPVARDTRNLTDAWKARVPSYSDEVPPLLDGYGDVIIPPQTIGSSWFGYFSPIVPKYKPEETDPIKKEGARLQAVTPRFGDAIGSGDLPDDWDITKALPGDPIPTRLTPKERHRWQVIYRNVIRGETPQNPGMIKLLLESKEYQEAPKALQREMFNSYLSLAKQQAGRALLVEDVELGQRVIQNNFRSVAPMLTREQREGVQAQVTDSVRLFEMMAPRERENLTQWGILAPDKPISTNEGLTIYTPYTIAPEGKQ